jgi:hypothetical protein
MNRNEAQERQALMMARSKERQVPEEIGINEEAETFSNLLSFYELYNIEENAFTNYVLNSTKRKGEALFYKNRLGSLNRLLSVSKERNAQETPKNRLREESKEKKKEIKEINKENKERKKEKGAPEDLEEMRAALKEKNEKIKDMKKVGKKIKDERDALREKLDRLQQILGDEQQDQDEETAAAEKEEDENIEEESEDSEDIKEDLEDIDKDEALGNVAEFFKEHGTEGFYKLYEKNLAQTISKKLRVDEDEVKRYLENDGVLEELEEKGMI